MYDSRYREKPLDYLLKEKDRIDLEINTLRDRENELRQASQVTHRRTSQQNVYDKMVNNNKEVMREALVKTGLMTAGLSVLFFFVGSILITSVVPLIIGSIAAGLTVSVPANLVKAAWKMRSYDRKNNKRIQNNNNTDYFAISSDINSLKIQLREVEAAIRHINPPKYKDSAYPQQVVVTYEQSVALPDKRQRRSAKYTEIPGLTVYPAQAYNGSVRLYNQSNPQQARGLEGCVTNGQVR